MTKELAKKMQINRISFDIAAMSGILELLLLGRLIAKLFAARPDNPSFQLLFLITEPFVALFRFLDADQPLFGAVLELSTLVSAICVPVVAYALWIIVQRMAAPADKRLS